MQQDRPWWEPWARPGNPPAEPQAPQAEVPQAEPEGQEAAPEAPQAEPEGQDAAPEAPQAEPEGQDAAPEAPQAEPEGQEAAPEAPQAEPEGQEAAPEAPDADPEAPEAEQGNPPVDPNAPPDAGPPAGDDRPRLPWAWVWPMDIGGRPAGPPIQLPGAPPVVIRPETADGLTVAVPVDLILENVEYVEPATAFVGPAYRVTYRNQGSAAAGLFRVAVVAGTDEAIDEQSPATAVEVEGLLAGETGQVTLRLPRAAMDFVAADGRTAAFNRLLVVVDFDGAIDESDKSNNLAIVARESLELNEE